MNGNVEECNSLTKELTVNEGFTVEMDLLLLTFGCLKKRIEEGKYYYQSPLKWNKHEEIQRNRVSW